MRASAAVLAGSAAALFAVGTARLAHAVGPVDIEAVGRFGYGTEHMNLDVGARAGVSFLGLYAGLNYVFYTGGYFPSTPSSVEQSSVMTAGGELGYGFKIAFVTLRPLVGLGGAWEANAPYIAGGAATSIGGLNTGFFYVQPGGLVQFTLPIRGTFGGHIILGVDASALMAVPVQNGARLVIEGQIGTKW
jgi:hypothetical protein